MSTDSPSPNAPAPASQRNDSLRVRIRSQSGSFTLDVAFEAPVGVTALVGASGAGKTQTLACIAGIHKPCAGYIVAGDATWFDSKNKCNIAIEQRRVAYVFQSLALFAHMTALQNVAYGMSRSQPRHQRNEHALTILKKMHVAHVAHRKPSSLSGGEAQRVALARALAMQPRAILLDEPFSALDWSLKRDLLEHVREILHAQRAPAIVVTHDPREAETLAERILRIDQGRIVATETVA